MAERPLVALVLRSLQRYIAIDGTQRGLVLAGQSFSALIPLLIVVSTLLSSNGGQAIAQRINDRFRLSGNAADSVRTLFVQPPNAEQTITFGSVLLLVVSGFSFARTMQRTYEAAWQLPPRGLRGTVGGVAALALLLTQILLLSLLAGFLRSVSRRVRPRVGAAWLRVQRPLARTAAPSAGRPRPWRRLLPGAIVSGAGQQGVAALSTLWIPIVVENNATRYGAIGVSFALLSWLVLISIVLVVAAAVSVEMGGGPPLLHPAAGSRPASSTPSHDYSERMRCPPRSRRRVVTGSPGPQADPSGARDRPAWDPSTAQIDPPTETSDPRTSDPPTEERHG